MNNPEQSRAFPSRADGKDWATQHMRAAQLRARGQPWGAVAEELGYALSTVQNYTMLGGFDELVAYYRASIFDQEIEQHFFQGSLKALQALQDQYTAGAQEVAAIERRLAALDEAIIEAQQAGEVEDALALIADRNELAKQIYSKSKVTTLAAGKYLDAIGFSTHRKRKAELETEKSVTNHYGQTVRHEGGEKPVEVKSDPGARAIEVAGILAGLGLPRPTDRADDTEAE
jgi:hypothetical protein